MGTGSDALEARESRYHKKMAKQIAKKGEVLLDLDDQVSDPRDDGVRYTELRVKLDIGEGEEVLGIMKREGPEGKQITFHYGQSIGVVLEGLVARLKNGTLKWREDKPYERS